MHNSKITVISNRLSEQHKKRRRGINLNINKKILKMHIKKINLKKIETQKTKTKAKVRCCWTSQARSTCLTHFIVAHAR